MRSSAEPLEVSETIPAGQLRLTTAGLTWLGVTLALGGIGWFKSMNLVLILGYLMLALLLLNGFLARAQVRRVSVLSIPIPPIFVGESTRLIASVRNLSSRDVTVSLSDPIGPENGWFVDRLAAASGCECTVRKAFGARGRVVAPPLRVWSGFPFGLIRFERPVTHSSREVFVLPALGNADAEGLRAWVLRHAGGDGRARKVLRRISSDSADVRGVRPFRPGDSLRAVHWPSTARRRELVVREYDSAPSPDLVVVVDPWVPVSPTTLQRANLEWALSLAATVMQTWTTAFHTRVTVALCSDSTSKAWSASGGEEFVRDSLVPLAEVRGTPAPRAPEPSAFDRSLAGAARVLISSREHSPLADALLRTTGRPFVFIGPAERLHWYQPPAESSQA